MRVLLYTANGSGLGHLARITRLATALAEQDWSCLIVTGSVGATYLARPPNVDVCTLPCLTKAPDGSRQTRSGYDTVASVLALRSELLLNLADAFDPDLLVVDHKPAGIRGELLPTLRHLKTKAHLVLTLRDFGGLPDVVAETWCSDAAHEAAHLYDRVLIFGRQVAYDWNPMLEALGVRVQPTYLGFLVQPASATCPPSRQSGTLLVAGGGAHGAEFVVAATPLLARGGLPTPVTFCQGPLAPQHDSAVSHTLSSRFGVSILADVPDLEGACSAFRLVVSSAGSIVSQFAYGGIAAILVPRRQASKEQSMRASYWSATTPFFSVLRPGLDPAPPDLEALLTRTTLVVAGATHFTFPAAAANVLLGKH